MFIVRPHDQIPVAGQYLMTVNELAELLILIGCGLLPSRTPINNGVP